MNDYNLLLTKIDLYNDELAEYSRNSKRADFITVDRYEVVI